MEGSRQYKIENFAGEGNLEQLKNVLGDSYNQLELDAALMNAIAYSKIEVANYLLSIGANLSSYNYEGTYYAVHNNELEGLKFAISKGVDVNVNNGMLLHESIVTAFNEKDLKIAKWLLENGADIRYLTEESIKTWGTKELIELIQHYK